MAARSFSLTAAKSIASDEDDNVLDISAGRASNAFDEMITKLVDDPSTTVAAKAQIFDAIVEQISAAGMPNLTGSSQSTGVSPWMGNAPAVQTDALQDRLDRAETQNTSLLKDRKILEQVAFNTGVPVPYSTNDPFDPSTAGDIKRMQDEKITEAATAAKAGLFTQDQLDAAIAAAMTTAGLFTQAQLDTAVTTATAGKVDKTVVKPLADAIDAWAKSLNTHFGKTGVKGKQELIDWSKLLQDALS